MTYDAARPTWPDDLDVERLPDDARVFVVGHRDGHRGRTHLFERCQTFDTDEANYRAVALGHPAANRDDICSVCLGDHAQPGEGPSGPWETLEEANPETPVDELADDGQPVPDGGRLEPHPLDGPPPSPIADGGQDVDVVDHGPPGDHTTDADPPADRDDQDHDGPTCDYGDCQRPAAEIYKVASPTGPLRMAACPDDAPEDATPSRKVGQ